MSLQTNEEGMKVEHNEDKREVVDDYGDLLFLEAVYITDNYGNSVQVWREIGELYEE
jgi:hypothetical protein